MSIEKAKSADTAVAGLNANTGLQQATSGGGVFHVQCMDKDGNLKWETSNHNLVVNEGLQYMNDTFFSGSSYTQSLYLGLITGPGSGTSYAGTDTLASHSWTEFTNYSGTRKATSFGSATSANPSVITSNSVSFSITSSGGVVAGAFLCTVSSGTSGVLFSESDFISPGDRTVVSGDTLNVTYVFTLTAV